MANSICLDHNVIVHGYRFRVKGMPGFSVGAIYASILNLPRHMCFKPEYTTLLTIMPGEPSLTKLNNVLKPIVDDLKVSAPDSPQKSVHAHLS